MKRLTTDLFRVLDHETVENSDWWISI